MKIIDDFKDIYTNTEGFAKCLGVTPRRINQLVKEGAFEKTRSGEIHVSSAILQYVRFKSRDHAEVEYQKEKALHEKAKRELAEIEVQTKRNELHAAFAVEQVMSVMLANTRTRLLGLGAALTPLLAGKKKGEINDIINSSIEEILCELKDYTPEMFSERALEYEEDN